MAPLKLKDLVAAAQAAVTTLSAEEAKALLGNPDVLFIDIRDDKERRQTGAIPGALHVPRGSLEFYADPDSPMHRPEFASGKQIVFYCAGGGRSVLAAKTAMDMGIERVAHLGGGFGAWVEAGGPVERTANG